MGEWNTSDIFFSLKVQKRKKQLHFFEGHLFFLQIAIFLFRFRFRDRVLGEKKKIWGQFHESKVRRNSTRRNFTPNFNRLFPTFFWAECTFTHKFWGKYYSEVEQNLLPGRKKGGKYQLKLRVKFFLVEWGNKCLHYFVYFMH